MSRYGAWAIAFALGLASVIPTASAQDATLQGGGMDLHLFRPAVDTRGYFAVNGSEVMPHKEFSFGLVLDAGFGILRYNGFVTDPSRAADERVTQNRIARQAFTGTFMFNFGLVDRLVVGISLPITFFRGHEVQVPDRGGSCLAGSTTCLYNVSLIDDEAYGLRSQGVGDLTIHTKVRLLNLGQFPVDVTHIRLVSAKGDELSSWDAGRFPGLERWRVSVIPDEDERQRVIGGVCVEGDQEPFKFNWTKGNLP